jgi:hypothetical protein
MPLIQHIPASRVRPDCAYLRGFAANVTSQFGEDGIIARILEIAGTTNRYACEFGAWDGKHFSNTWNLIARHGWRGLLIEGDRDRFAALQQTYAGRSDVRLLNAMVAIQGERSLDSLLAAAGAPRDLDVLSIDVDGVDWHLWNTLVIHRPRVLVIEINPTIPNDVIFIQDPDPAVNQGASLRAMVELGKRKRYELVATTLCNALFVDAQLFPRFSIPDNSVDTMHELGSLETKIFQLYDGTLMLAGYQRLNWHNLPIEVEKIQVLPPQMRRFPG